jgi:hypothetical protein
VFVGLRVHIALPSLVFFSSECMMRRTPIDFARQTFWFLQLSFGLLEYVHVKRHSCALPAVAAAIHKRHRRRASF